MTHSPETPEVPIRPYEVTAAEVVPGDLFAPTTTLEQHLPAAPGR